MRKSLIGFGIVAGAAAAVAAAPYFIDWNGFKPELVAAVEAATGYEVAVAGDIGFSLLPSPRLSAEGLRVTGFGAARAPLLTAEKLSAAVRFWPLLSKRAEVDYILLDTPVVRLTSYGDGSNNWTDPDRREREAPGGTLSVADFRIENGTLLRAGTDGSETRLDDINTRIAIAGIDGPYSIKGTLRYGDWPLDILAHVKPGGGVTLTAATGDDAKLIFKGRVGSGDGGPTPVSGRLAIEAASLSALLADGDNKAAAYARPLSLKTVLRGTTEKLSLADISGSVGGSRVGGALNIDIADRTRVSGRLLADRIEMADWLEADDDKADTEPFELPDVEANIVTRIGALTYGDMTFGALAVPLSLSGGRLVVGRTTLSLPGGGTAVVTGVVDAFKAKPRFSGNIMVDALRPATVLAAFGNAGYASLPSLTATSRVGFANDVVSLPGIRGRLDGAPFDADLVYPLNTKRAISAKGRLQRLDLNRVVARTSARADSDGSKRAVDFNLAIGELVSGDSRYAGLSARGRFADDRLSLVDAVVRDAFGFGVRAQGNISDVSGKRVTDLTLSLAGKEASGGVTVKGPLAQVVVGGAVTYAGARIALDGWVRTDPNVAYEIDAKASAPEAGLVLARLRDEARHSKLGPLNLGMRIVGSDDKAMIKGLGGQLGGMALSGSATIDTAAAQPVVNANLKAGQVPLLALMGDDGTGAAEAAKGGARWSAEPLSFAWIDSFDGRLTITAARATYDTYVFDAPSLVVTSSGSRLAIESLVAGMYGGRLTASGTLTAGAHQGLALKVALNDVPVEPLMQAATASAPATGTLDFSADVSARGSSQLALMNSLSGPARIAASNGVIRKVDLKRLDAQLGDLRSVASFVQFAGAALQGGETQYRSFVADLSGTGGRFTIGKVTSDMDGGRATATGYVDIGDWYADARAVLVLGRHDDAPAIPATIRGPLPAPTVDYSLGPLKAWFGKRIALAGIKAATGEDKLDLGTILGVRKPAADASAAQTSNAASGQAAAPAPAPARRPSVEDELGGALVKGIGSLFGKKKPVPQDAPAEERPLEPQQLGDPN
jgi:uncharacterized protein involved in outer membrane biogenesis